MQAIERQSLETTLARCYQNLAYLYEKSAKYGLDIPLRVVNEIDEIKDRIREIKARLTGATEEPSLASQYFSKGFAAYVMGDFGEARRYFKMTLDIDPYYPRAEEYLESIELPVVARYSPTDYDPGRSLSKRRLKLMLWLILILCLGIGGSVIGGLAGLGVIGGALLAGGLGLWWRWRVATAPPAARP